MYLRVCPLDYVMVTFAFNGGRNTGTWQLCRVFRQAGGGRSRRSLRSCRSASFRRSRCTIAYPAKHRAYIHGFVLLHQNFRDYPSDRGRYFRIYFVSRHFQ